jgi:hypothetical protein
MTARAYKTNDQTIDGTNKKKSPSMTLETKNDIKGNYNKSNQLKQE